MAFIAENKEFYLNRHYSEHEWKIPNKTLLRTLLKTLLKHK
jgi:hypothetical protein